MKPLVLIAALVFMPVSAALAQTPAPAVAAPTADSVKAEAAFRTTWTSIAAGAPDYSTMSDTLAGAVKAQGDAMKSAAAQLGPIKSMDYLGVGPSGVQLFRVNFAPATLDGGIHIGADGKIDTMWIKRPA